MKPTLSCEFFPVATQEGAQKLAEVREALAFMECEYFSELMGQEAVPGIARFRW